MNIFSKNIRFLSVLTLGFMLCANMPVQAMFGARARATGLATGYATRATFAAKPSVLASGIAKPGMVNQNMAKNISFRVPMQTPSVFNAWSNRVTSVFKPFYNYVRTFCSAANVPHVPKSNGMSDGVVDDEQVIKNMLLKEGWDSYKQQEVIRLWLVENSSKIDVLAQVVVNNIVEIVNGDRLRVLVPIFSKCSTVCVNKIVEAVADNITKINEYAVNFILSCCNAQGANKIASAIVAHNITKLYNFADILEKCTSDHADQLVAHIMNTSGDIYELAALSQYSLSLKKGLKAANSALDPQNPNLTVDQLKSMLLYGSTATENTQSRGHIDRNLGSVGNFVNKIEDKHLLQMFAKALSQEAAYAKQRCVVLYHGMQPDDHFRYELFTRLATLVYDVPDKWFFLRFFDTSGKMLTMKQNLQRMGTINKHVALTANELTDTLQEKLLKGQQYENNEYYRELCFFMNSALFGCLNRLGSCTAYYLHGCHTQRDVEFTVKDLMDALGFKGRPEFVKICDELQKLQIINRNLGKYGRLLQIAVPEKHINKLVYPADGGGPLKEVKIGDKLTTDMAAIVKAYQTQPNTIEDSDNTETVAPLTTHALLNPKNPYGVKMVVHYAGDQQKYAEYQARFDAVMQKAYDLVCTLSDEERNKLVKGLAVIMQDGDAINCK